MRSLVEFLAKSAVFEDTDHCYINLSCMVVTFRDVVCSFKLKLLFFVAHLIKVMKLLSVSTVFFIYKF
jgi:hypothetical protein